MKEKTVTCPNCKKPSVYSTENPNRPFCSERCKLIDLGEWASGKYKVPGEEMIDPQQIEEEESRGKLH